MLRSGGDGPTRRFSVGDSVSVELLAYAQALSGSEALPLDTSHCQRVSLCSSMPYRHVSLGLVRRLADAGQPVEPNWMLMTLLIDG